MEGLKKMFPLKLIRSLVLGDTINNNNFFVVSSQNHAETNSDSHNINRNKKLLTSSSSKTPLLLFLPTKELVSDTNRLATIARDMGMDLYPTPSLSHIIFSYSSSTPPSWHSSICLSQSLVLPNDAVPLTFPSLSTSSLSHLRSFVSLSKGLFKLVFATQETESKVDSSSSHWDCCSFSLFSRLNGDRIDSMEAFSRVLAGIGWTLFKTKNNSNQKSVYLFRKVNMGRVRSSGYRIRELRLPALDFKNAPLRILQYVVLMTDGAFYLA